MAGREEGARGAGEVGRGEGKGGAQKRVKNYEDLLLKGRKGMSA